MGHARSVRLLDEGAATGADFTWEGGKSVTVAAATTHGTSMFLQLKLPNDAYVNVGSDITANNVSAGLDLPAGTYRAFLSGGSPVEVTLILCRIPQ